MSATDHPLRPEHRPYARRHLFEQIAAGLLDPAQIRAEAERLDLDLEARSYTVALFTVPPEPLEAAAFLSDPGAAVRSALLAHFLKYSEYILFPWGPTVSAVLIKGGPDGLAPLIQRCISAVQEGYEQNAPDLPWHIAVGRPAADLQGLTACFEETARFWSWRHILPDQHVLTAGTLDFFTGAGVGSCLLQIDPALADPAVVRWFLDNGSIGEAAAFADSFLHPLAGALNFRPFCLYLMFSAWFAAGQRVTAAKLPAGLRPWATAERAVGPAELRQYLTELLTAAIALRDGASDGRSHGPLGRAVAYINGHASDPDLSLAETARQVQVNASYLSFLFRRDMDTTFTDYVARRRMEQAERLLRFTNRPTGEIARAVGYRNARYFSSLFRKTHGCTPTQFRGRQR